MATQRRERRPGGHAPGSRALIKVAIFSAEPTQTGLRRTASRARLAARPLRNGLAWITGLRSMEGVSSLPHMSWAYNALEAGIRTCRPPPTCGSSHTPRPPHDSRPRIALLSESYSARLFRGEPHRVVSFSRTRCGFGPRQPAKPRGPRRQRLGDQWSEGVDLIGALQRRRRKLLCRTDAQAPKHQASPPSSSTWIHQAWPSAPVDPD